LDFLTRGSLNIVFLHAGKKFPIIFVFLLQRHSYRLYEKPYIETIYENDLMGNGNGRGKGRKREMKSFSLHKRKPGRRNWSR
jgi:hypothetical protein